jgi:hypothetical protein
LSDKVGKKVQSKRDLERIYAEDPHFLDVEARLGLRGDERPPPRPDI